MFKLSDDGVEFVKKELQRYETPRSAIIPALFRAQTENGGWVSPECVAYLSQLMDLPEAWINEVLHFYTMFNKEPVGKYHVQVCCNVSCAMNGGRELADHLCRSFKVKAGDVSEDGRYTISRVECLGSCGTAPMMQVNDQYFEDLTPESAVKLLQEMK
ncbi:MAG: NAD(P)H-dependent oxidoreductase subunit E [Pseudobdellovibrionaceae bacterium]|nr:NAD(P)H-dependent oxidoreductase subunit E [Bdellovibrionales bacterium]USN46320.1 MAG: NAD(P)H-dependent oxidoreductase subunit E [Pseudobdellovibrionaceae bacterium]